MSTAASTAVSPRTGPRVVCVGPHIVDVLVRPVTGIPAGQGGALVDQLRITAAGTAAGTAVDLAKLGAEVTSIGAVGDDTVGSLLRILLEQHGVDASRLVVRPGLATSATVLPIRPNGERPSLHLPGATATLTGADVDPALVADADALHLGGPDVLGAFTDEAGAALLRHARAHGTTTTVDLLRSATDPALLDRLTPLLPSADYFLPNDDQLRGLTGIDDLERAARTVRERGVGTVVVTMGGAGSLLVGSGPAEHLPAFSCDVVDTTGCGDAFVAGLLVGLHQGWEPRLAAALGTAAAGLVATGLGSDAGVVDLPTTVAFWKERATDIGVTPP
ncbi:carbohydrate kinase family protein [Pseudonocardia humida]|uniref:carbohydrate kinase family protein n=1 Tax=Pseudonocardia humida TaxID=2800819 RepID=UPI00207D422F|nr:PfkB family carbohydrate kinase [Pseudonocardia humida]